ncbi:hypothetical protein GLOTRDRAFT_116058 [Gloeophyllum trabeum ATCC 11539]|uniref:Uncharacterized protein n=1 Tax=Gloeophyllum trabeum (strain ATCC 11539 / FP-39264 / Madison 617) TaxID=670483 RepID=S7RS85_GLOTA|nr:uncharacterized protein GLOTRDRAFT_116058 [Gloeophyllum trabeum ATCC 11539]EPQ55894.1 hypothetical protein GLOTRDRAFT_116058 [Gloeophyllum trabeum ATCC 11539]
MSLSEADAKFPGQIPPTKTEGPDPSRENPAGVYPKVDPTPAPPDTEPGTGARHESKEDYRREPAADSAETGGMFKD